jgi:hypothetical protein
MIDVVKQALDVKLQNPVILPAPLSRGPYGIQSRFIRPVAVRVWKKDRV